MAQQATQTELNRKIRDLQRSWDDAVAQNRNIQGQIEQLKEARRHVGEAKKYANAVHNSIRGLKVDDDWKGQARTRLDKQCIDVGMCNDADHFHANICELDSQIRAKIGELCGQVNYLVKFISDIGDGIDAANRELNKLLSGED